MARHPTFMLYCDAFLNCYIFDAVVVVAGESPAGRSRGASLMPNLYVRPLARPYCYNSSLKIA